MIYDKKEMKHLPIGTIVKLGALDKELMIVSQFPVSIIENVKGYFDFGGVELPAGVGDKELVLFNKEDIEKVIYMGYIDIFFQELLNKYDDIINNIEFPKFTHDMLKNNNTNKNND